MVLIFSFYFPLLKILMVPVITIPATRSQLQQGSHPAMITAYNQPTRGCRTEWGQPSLSLWPTGLQPLAVHSLVSHLESLGCSVIQGVACLMEACLWEEF